MDTYLLERTWQRLDEIMEQERLQMEQTMQRIQYYMQEMEHIMQWPGFAYYRVHNAQQQLHHGAPPLANTSTEHAPLAPASAGEYAPPPQSPWQHDQDLSVAHKRAMQTTQPVHATLHELPRQRVAMPTAEEGANTTPGHVASRPHGPSVVLTRATATRPKRRPTVQHRRNGVKVRRPPPCSQGTRPPLLTPCVQGKPQRCAEARDAEPVE